MLISLPSFVEATLKFSMVCLLTLSLCKTLSLQLIDYNKLGCYRTWPSPVLTPED